LADGATLADGAIGLRVGPTARAGTELGLRAVAPRLFADSTGLGRTFDARAGATLRV
jgi:hypothetical protein